MRVVLHIGQQKTGTTSIQLAYTLAADALTGRGVLYPRPVSDEPRRLGHYNHAPLATVLDLPKAPRGLVRFLGEGRLVDRRPLDRVFDWFCREVESDIASHAPDVLVLSAETMFRPLSVEAAARLTGWLDRLSDDTSVVAYLRRPSELYLSSVQQRLRSGSRVPPPGPMRYRGVLEGWRRAFGDRLHLVEYNRAAFVDNDVVADFTRRFVPEIAGTIAMSSPVMANSTASAEVLAVMQDAFGRERSAIGDRDFAFAVEKQIRLAAERHNLDTGKARLRPEVARYVDQVSVDTHWLRDELGVEFQGLEYGALGIVGDAAMDADVEISTICEVDQEVRTVLARHASGAD